MPLNSGDRDTPAGLQHSFLLRPRTLAALTFLLGLTYLALTPPFQVPDEHTHFLRSFQVSQGTILGVKQDNQAGGFLPKTFLQDLAFFPHLAGKPQIQTSYGEWRQNLRESRPLTALHLSEQAFAHFPNTVRYSPVPYLPQALGINLAKGLALNTLETLYLSRFLTLVASVVLLTAAFWLCAFSIRLRLALFLLATMPMSMFLLASISADAPTISLALVTAALCIRLTQQWSDRLFIWLLVCAVLLSLCKPCYLLIPLAGLPAVWQAPVRRHCKVGAAAALVAVAVLPALAWTALTTSLFVSLLPNHLDNPHLQLHYVLEQPVTVMLTFISCLKKDFQGIWLSFIGVLGWLDTFLPQPVYKFYPLLLALTAVTGISSQEQGRRSTWGAAGFAASLFLASSGLLLLASYLTWTPVQAPYVDGIQGRYFLPLVPLVLLWLPPICALKEKWYRIFTLGVFLVWAYLSYLSVAGLFHRFWK
jgi:uncharacterized membrane protein